MIWYTDLKCTAKHATLSRLHLYDRLSYEDLLTYIWTLRPITVDDRLFQRQCLFSLHECRWKEIRRFEQKKNNNKMQKHAIPYFPVTFTHLPRTDNENEFGRKCSKNKPKMAFAHFDIVHFFFVLIKKIVNCIFRMSFGLFLWTKNCVSLVSLNMNNRMRRRFIVIDRCTQWKMCSFSMLWFLPKYVDNRMPTYACILLHYLTMERVEWTTDTVDDRQTQHA